MAFRLKTGDLSWLDRTLIGVMVGAIALLMVALFAWQIPLGSQVQLEAGSVAPYTVIAPKRISFESQVMTDQARERAAFSVPEQYDVAEGRIRRRQVSRAEKILEFMSIVRNDVHAGESLKIDYLTAVTDFTLPPEIARKIIELDNTEWTQVVDTVPEVLDLVMRDEIRDTTVASARRKVPALVDADTNEDLGQVTVEIIRALVQPNSFVNAERTEEMRQAARDNVPMQVVNIEADEVIIRGGDIATAQDVEALIQIGLLQSEWDWWTVVRAALFTFLVLALTGAAIFRLRPRTLGSVQEMAILVVTASVWLIGAKFMIIPHDWLPYLFPLAALSMLIAVLIDLRVAMIITIAFLFVVQYIGNSALIMIYAGAGAFLGALVLGRADRLSAFVWAGLVIAAANLFAMGAYRAPYDDYATGNLVQLHLIMLLNGGLSASIALIGYFVMGNLFGITTSLQLTELSRPTHPLLRQLLLKSPGTYHHTIVVSNLAERAAAAIGADAFLSRVGAYYHDIGKTVRPYFFTENIADGTSPHEKLDPETSAQIIISHVKEGLNLADKYHLPPRIRDFIREHHGRSLVKYFYIQAQNQADDGVVINPEDYRYPGPSPRSKETAIMLLADTCEAAVRSVRPGSRSELKDLINRLIDERIADGELDESNLTFKEVQTIKEVFMRVLEGVHHPRISYPEPAKRTDNQTPSGNGATLPPTDGGGRSVQGGVEEMMGEQTPVTNTPPRTLVGREADVP